MTDQPGYQLVVAAFTDQDAASQALVHLKGEYQGRRDVLPAATAVTKDVDGHVSAKEAADPRQGALVGAIAGGALGLLAGRRRALLGAGIGALVGSVVATRLDSGIPNARLAAVGETLAPGTSAAVFLVADSAYETLADTLKTMGASLSAEPFARPTGLMAQLQAGDFAGAAASLSDQAAGALAGVTSTAQDLARQAADKAQAAADAAGQQITSQQEE